MDYDKFILVDYENFMDIYIDTIDEKTKMIIIVDEKQNTMPIDLIKTTRSFGKSIECVQIKNNGKENTLYFFILYFLGYYIANNSNKEFIIYSSNNSYDPLIEYLQNKNINVKIISEFKQKNLNRGFKKILGQISTSFNRLSIIQKICLTIIALTVIIGIVAIFTISPKHPLVPVISVPISDVAARDRIVVRMDQEGVKSFVSPTGLVQVTDKDTARRMRAILVREDLIPSGINPWEIFDRERWTTTDIERNVGIQRAIRQMIIDHIKAIDDIDDAQVILTFPKDELFASQQNPVKASVIITPRPGSDIARPEGRKKIEGIQKLLKSAVDGLQDENITITDQRSNILNDFAGMEELDRINLADKEAKHIQKLEAEYGAKALRLLQQTFSADRIRDLSVSFDKNMSRESYDSKIIDPIIIKPQTPGLSYDDSERVLYANRSQTSSKTTWTGTGFNPEGPAGVEGQTPRSSRTESYTWEERSPTLNRLTVVVNIDGTWHLKYDEKGKPIVKPDGTIEREYTPIPLEQMRAAAELVQDAIGYNAGRSDSVTVRNIPFDRTAEHKAEDAAYFRYKKIMMTVIIIFSSLTLLLILDIIVDFFHNFPWNRRTRKGDRHQKPVVLYYT